MDLEPLVKIAAALGFNPVSVRWRLAKLKRRLDVRRHQATAQVNQLRHEHKFCPACGRLMDRADKSCVSCGERASSWLVHFLGRLGVKAPAILSAAGLLGGASLAGGFALVMLPRESRAGAGARLDGEAELRALYKSTDVEQLLGPWVEACKLEHEGRVREAQLVLDSEGMALGTPSPAFSPEQLRDNCRWYGQTVEGCKQCGSRSSTSDDGLEHFCGRFCDALLE